MSTYWAVNGVTSTLHDLLEEHITYSEDLQIQGVGVSTESPRRLRSTLAADKRGISIWLYRVTRNPDLLNAAPERTGPDTTLRHPLPIDLHYLMTPIAGTAGDEQLLLGRVLQVLNDHAIVRGDDLRTPLDPERVELRVVLDTLSLEDLTRIWNALQEPYDVSVAYVVQFLSVESHHEPTRRSPVLVREDGYEQIVGRG